MAETLLEEPFSTTPARSGQDQEGRPAMKLVSCMIRPESVEAVKEALDALQVVGGITITEVRGFGRQRGQVEHYRGGEYTIRLLPKIKVDVAIREEDIDRVVTAIGKAARTGQVGDGKVFVQELRNAVRIRTGEQGATAL